MIVTLVLWRADGGRMDGAIQGTDGTRIRTFAGMLELLAILEDEVPATDGEHPRSCDTLDGHV